MALVNSSGSLRSQVRYDPYGVPFGIAKTDLDDDGDVDASDASLYTTLYNGGAGTHPYADWNWDGSTNGTDPGAYTASKSVDSGLGRGVGGYDYSNAAAGANRKLYAGYEIDPVLTGSEGWESAYHVRHRVYLSQLGRWTRRDPLGYVDASSLYEYVRGRCIRSVDPVGLALSDVGGALDCAIFIMFGDGPGDCDDRQPVDEEPAPLTIRECCRISEERNNQGKNRSGGALTCCDGVPVPCVFIRKILPDKDTDARHIAIHCAAMHECRHKLDQCDGLIDPCPNTPGYDVPPSMGEGMDACLECRAWKENYECLTKRAPDCEDSRCERDISDEIARALGKMRENCNKCEAEVPEEDRPPLDPPFTTPNPGTGIPTETDWEKLWEQPWNEWCTCQAK